MVRSTTHRRAGYRLRQNRPTSPRRCVGCVADSRVWRRLDDRRIGYPLSKHRCCGSSSVSCGRSTTIASRVSSNNVASWALAPATTMLNGPPVLPQAGSACCQPCRDPLGWVQSDPLPNVPCPWPRLPPAIPSPRRPTLRTVPPRLSIFGARHPVPPTVERCDGLCCRPPVLSAIGSIGTRCASENDAVEHLSGVSPLAASDFRRVCLQDDRPNESQARPGASHMVSKPSWLFTKFLQMFWEKPYELPHKPLKAFVRYDFEIVSKRLISDLTSQA